MKYFVKVGDRVIEIDLVERDGVVFAIVGNHEHQVSYAEVDGLGQYSVLVGQASWAASIEPGKGAGGNDFSVGLAGERFAVSIENERERSAHSADRRPPSGPRTIAAAMPGIVVSIVVKEGEAVAEGAPLLILEAMKMQNEVRAEIAGVVTKVAVEPGNTVSAGQPLATIEPREGTSPVTKGATRS